jgi:hypothetical protein
MEAFPKDFAAMLSPKGRRILERGYGNRESVFGGDETPIALLPGMLDAKQAGAGARLLDRALIDHVKRVSVPVPPETITEMTENYGELLPKSLSFSTVYFGSKTSKAWQAAEAVGLMAMMRSEAVMRFAEAVTGLTLKSDRGAQVILYRPGDYAGPHNDHHPESAAERDGFVDLHISLTTPEVASQYLVCEDKGHLSKMYPCALNGSVAVYKLPFWHYTTPLQAKRGKAADARRWLLLRSFEIARPGLNRRGR